MTTPRTSWRPARGVQTVAVGAAYVLALSARAAAPHGAGRDAPAIAGIAVAFGAALGLLVTTLRALRRALAREPPARASAWRELTVDVIAVASLHAASVVWSMARDPALYASGWYGVGGLRRTVQVIACDTLHPAGVAAIAGVGLVVAVLGPPSCWNGALRIARGWLARRTWKTAAVGAISAGVAAWMLLPPRSTSTPPGADTRPNVLVLVAGGLRADHLDTRFAPHLAALAERGTRFDRAYTSLPETRPAVVTWLTGRFASGHGVHGALPTPDEPTRTFDALPARLSRSGYVTALLSDLVDPDLGGLPLGFTALDVPGSTSSERASSASLARQTPLLSVLQSRPGRWVMPAMRDVLPAADPSALARAAARTLGRLSRKGPFFAMVAFAATGMPYASSSSARARLDSGYRGPFAYVGPASPAPPDLRDREAIRARYDDAVAGLDDAVQIVLDALDRSTTRSSTIVVLTSAHGETLDDAGRGYGHGAHLLGDASTHVPLVIAAPGHAARRADRVVRDADLAPTLAALTGIELPAGIDGVSLAPALDGASQGDAVSFAEAGDAAADEPFGWPSTGRPAAWPRALSRQRMVRDGRWKLVYAPTRDAPLWLLFDAVEDPGETRDVAPLHPDVVSRLRPALTQWVLRDPAVALQSGYFVPRE